MRSVYPRSMVGCLIAACAAFGCSSGLGPERSRPGALSYARAFGGPPQSAATGEPAPAQASGPRLVRRPDGSEPAASESDKAQLGPSEDRSVVETTPGASTAAGASTHARHAQAIGGGPASAVEPSTTLPSPPATLDVPPRAGVDAAIRAVPAGVPTGHLSREALVLPLQDRARYDRCGIPTGTRITIDAVVYNGAAVGVDVRAAPRDSALEFCVEQVVREASWVEEPAVNRVKYTL